jgi:hypothetical protein
MSRGLSTALGYVLTLGVTVLLVSGLFVAGGSFVENQREEVIRTELDIVGEQVATHLNAAERLNESGVGETNVTIEQRFPPSVVGSSYRISLEADEQRLRLTTDDPNIEVSVPVTTTTTIADSSATGGQILIEYDQDQDAVVIDNA